MQQIGRTQMGRSRKLDCPYLSCRISCGSQSAGIHQQCQRDVDSRIFVASFNCNAAAFASKCNSVAVFWGVGGVNRCIIGANIEDDRVDQKSDSTVVRSAG